MIEKKMVGTRFNKRTFDKRIQFIGFPEHINDDINIPHYHLLVKFPDNIKNRYRLRYKRVFKELLHEFWGKFFKTELHKFKRDIRLEPDGPVVCSVWDASVVNRYCKVKRIRSKGVVDYITKDLGKVFNDNEEHIIFNEVPFK